MIKIISFVDSFKHYNEPINEFLKRLARRVEFVRLKPSKAKEISKIITDETLELQKILGKIKGYKVLLFIEGKELSTTEFVKFIEENEMKYSDVVFVVGGAYGVNIEILQDSLDFKLSFSKMTFPHGQAIMMLLEQIYRVECIKKGGNYHH